LTAPNPQAQAPDASINGRYRMGPLLTPDASVDFWWNVAAADGTVVVGQSSGWDDLDYITPIDQVGGRDGGLSGPSSVGVVIINVAGVLVAPTARTLRENIRRMRRILGPQSITGPRQPLVWEQHDFGWGQRLALVCRPTGKFAAPIVAGHVEGGVAASVSFSLVAANPVWKYLAGIAESAQAGLLNPALVGGRTYDKTFNYTYGSSTNPGGELVAVNQGDLDAFPVFRVTGPAAVPIIQNATTGQTLTINYTIAAGETVTVDALTGSVTPGQVRLIGRPFSLAPGANTIRWRTFVDSYDPAALLRLEWRSTYS
jgi:hypothetical protein